MKIESHGSDDKLFLSTKSLVSFLGEDLNKSFTLPLETFETELSDRIGASNLENLSLASLMVEVAAESLQEEVLEREGATFEPTTVSDSGKIHNKILSYGLKLGSGIKSLFRNYFPKSGRSRLIVAGILILIIALGVGFKIKSSKDAQRQLAFNQFLKGERMILRGLKGWQH